MEIHYAERNRLPNVTALIKKMGLVVCHNKQSLDEGCIELKRVTDDNRRKYWALISKDGIIYYNSNSGESTAVVIDKSKLENVAKITFSKKVGSLTLSRIDN